MNFPKRIEADDLDLWQKELKLAGPFELRFSGDMKRLTVSYDPKNAYYPLATYCWGKGYWSRKRLYRGRLERLGLD